MKELYELLKDAAEFCKAADMDFVSIVKDGETFYFSVYNESDPKNPSKTRPIGICSREGGKDFTFDIPLYKRGALDFLGIRSEDTDWKIDDEDMFRIKFRIEALNKKLSEY